MYDDEIGFTQENWKWLKEALQSKLTEMGVRPFFRHYLHLQMSESAKALVNQILDGNNMDDAIVKVATRIIGMQPRPLLGSELRAAKVEIQFLAQEIKDGFQLETFCVTTEN